MPGSSRDARSGGGLGDRSGNAHRPHARPAAASARPHGARAGARAHRYRPPVARGRLITIEGLDGAGKSTLAEALAARARRPRLARGAAARAGRRRRSPSASARSSRTPRSRSPPRAEALLYAAARAQLVQERLEPLLEQGAVVLLDRFVDSSLAYQGAGRALGVRGGARDQPLRHRRPAARPHAAAAHRPGRRARAPATSARSSPTGSSARARTSSRRSPPPTSELARAEPERIRAIDATQAPEQVLRDALAALADLLWPARATSMDDRWPAPRELSATSLDTAIAARRARAAPGARCTRITSPPSGHDRAAASSRPPPPDEPSHHADVRTPRAAVTIGQASAAPADAPRQALRNALTGAIVVAVLAALLVLAASAGRSRGGGHSSPAGCSRCATRSPRRASARRPPGPNSATGCGSGAESTPRSVRAAIGSSAAR